MVATTGMMTAMAAFLAIGLDSSSHKRFRWGSIPAAMLAATMAAILAQPLGLFLQKNYTTSGYPGKLEIKNISLNPTANVITHRINTVQ